MIIPINNINIVDVYIFFIIVICISVCDHIKVLQIIYSGILNFIRIDFVVICEANSTSV